MKFFAMLLIVVGAACTPAQRLEVIAQYHRDHLPAGTVTGYNHGPYRAQEDDPVVVRAFKQCEVDGLICSIERDPDGSLEVVGRTHG